MAEAILKRRWKLGGIGDIKVASMGISGIEDSPASEFAQQVCLEHGIDISHHNSQGLDLDEMAEADIILAMEPFQKKHLQLLFPAFRDKIALLGAWPDKETRNSLIRDPIGTRLKVYRSVYEKIDHHIERILPILRVKAHPPAD